MANSLVGLFYKRHSCCREPCQRQEERRKIHWFPPLSSYLTCSLLTQHSRHLADTGLYIRVEMRNRGGEDSKANKHQSYTQMPREGRKEDAIGLKHQINTQEYNHDFFQGKKISLACPRSNTYINKIKIKQKIKDIWK